jgi:putative ABC transport system ATP-binding protein
VTAPVVEVRDLEFGWTRERPLLRIDHLAITAGERVFVHGPSGSGKSSLLSLLAGGARDAFRADHFGIIFQQINLVPYLSIIDNATLPCSFSRRRTAQTAPRGGVVREAERLLAHLDLAAEARSSRAVTQLSVGQQQRVAAARALIGRPEIILADEPTSALDADRREAFLQLLFRECEAEGATLVFVSHDRGLQALFDRAVSLADLAITGATVDV